MKKNIFLLIAIVCSLTLQQGFAAVDNKAEGKRLCQLGKYEEALPYLQKAVRQSRKSGALWYLAIVQQHLYQFDEALEAAETYQTVLNSPEWLERADSLISELKACARAYEHIEDVVIIDSMLVDEADFFSYYMLGNESGRVAKADGRLYYESQAGDHRIFSRPDGLYETQQFQGKWEEERPLKGLGTEQYHLIDPFLRSDGETIYFACDSTPGMGGYDIYRTTYNSEEGEYYQPERLGMPFNSPYNDYMMAIDETHQVGWWATDRNAPAGKVTIYRFLVEDDPRYLDEPTVSRARIDDLRETWREEGGYQALIDELREAPQEPVVEEPQEHIVISDGRVYTSADQFRSPQARSAYQKSVALGQKISEMEATLAQSRRQYAQASPQQRQTLAQSILRAEEALVGYYEEQREAVKDYRRLEQ